MVHVLVLLEKRKKDPTLFNFSPLSRNGTMSECGQPEPVTVYFNPGMEYIVVLLIITK
jgi:hypothetical protein